MPQFKRIGPGEKPKDAEGADKDVQLDDLGFLFCKHNGKWKCESRLAEPGGRVHDVVVHPPCQLGRPGDVACTSDSKWWKKNSRSEWIFQYYLILPRPADVTTGKLVVTSNLTLPIVNGWIPLYDARGNPVAKVKAYPLDADS